MGAAPYGSFTTKSAYLTQVTETNRVNNSEFKFIWKWKGIERVRTFMWKLTHEALLTNVERVRRTMATDSTCPMCGFDIETLFHRF